MNTHSPNRNEHPEPSAPRRTARVVTVASGKGGVGKTNLVANIAVVLASRRVRVCVLDADAGMANINVLFGFNPRYTLADVLNRTATLDEALVKGPHGACILPAASGIAGVATLNTAQRRLLLEVVMRLEDQFDVVLIDAAAGADSTVTDLMCAAHRRLVVVTPDPTSLTNAYSLLKILQQMQGSLQVGVVVNQANDADNADITFQRLKKVTDLFLDTQLEYLGFVRSDMTVTTAIRLQRPVVLLKHDAPASRCMYRLAETLLRWIGGVESVERFSAQWQHALPAPTSESAPEPAASFQPPVATLPAEPLEIVPVVPPPDRSELIQHLVGELAAGAISERDAGVILLELLSACLSGYGRYPIDIRRLIGAALNRRDLTADALCHLVNQLQSTYRERYGHEMYPVDSPPVRTAEK